MNIKSLAVDVAEYVQQRLDQYLVELQQLCAVDSPSHYKPGLDEMIKVFSARMSGLGMKVNVFEHKQWGNDLLGIIQGDGEGRVILVGHVDTVYPLGIAAARPLNLKENVVNGPGVSDMKGCILSAIYALEALFSLGFRDFGEIRFLCVSDEEISNRHSLDIIRDASLNCDAALVLEAASANGDIVSARKGTVHYKLSARGLSTPVRIESEIGRRSSLEISNQIGQIYSLNGWCEGLTITPSLEGDAENITSDYTEVIFDIRFLHQNDRFATEEKMRQMLQKRFTPEVSLILEALPNTYNPMVRTPESMELVDLAQVIASSLNFSLNHTLRGGSSDGCTTSGYGIPTIDGLGPIGGLDHSPNEYLLLDSVPLRAALLAGLIACLGNQEARNAVKNDSFGRLEG